MLPFQSTRRHIVVVRATTAAGRNRGYIFAGFEIKGRAVQVTKQKRWWVAAAVLLLVLLIIFLPLKLVLRQTAPGLEAEKVEGTIWNGRLRGAHYGDIPIGDVDAGLDFSRLLGGEASIRFKRFGPVLAGSAGGTFDDRRLDNLNGKLPLAVLPTGLPPITLQFDRLTVHMGLRNNCLATSGVVTASLPEIPGVGALPTLTGAPQCDGDAIVVPLATPDGRFSLDLGLAPGGVWRAGLGVRLDNKLAVGVLQAIGFTATADGVRTDSTGTVDDLRALEQAVRAEAARETAAAQAAHRPDAP